MALIAAQKGSSGGGNEQFVVKSGSLPANTPLNVNITGKAKNVYFLDNRGYVNTNTNPTTGEISTSSSFTSGAWSDTFTENTALYYILSDGNISMNRYWTQSTSLTYFLIYTLE